MINRTDERLRDVTAAYGARATHWPEPERAALESAAARDPAAFEEARQIDLVLASATRPEVPANGPLRLAQRIIPAGPGATVVALARRRHPVRPTWAIAASLAAALACGAYLGTLQQADLFFDPGVAVSDDPVDLAGLGDVTDYLGDET